MSALDGDNTAYKASTHCPILPAYVVVGPMFCRFIEVLSCLGIFRSSFQFLCHWISVMFFLMS